MATMTAEIKTLPAAEIARKRTRKGITRTTGQRLRQMPKAQSKIHNDYENDVVEIPVVKKVCFKFNRPTKLEFV